MTTHRLPGMVLCDRSFSLPLDHDAPGAERIEVFAREVVQPGKEEADLPWLLFLQGGPGFESPRPPAGAAWLPLALKEYRVLLLDQRGTGRSSRLDATTLARFAPKEQARRLGLHRLDSIVRDCEAIRRELIGDGRWTVLGQSYGGFCATHYLSAFPEGLAAVLITGGLPPLTAHVDDVYRRTYVRCREKNEAYYARYPGDEELVRAVVRHLGEREVILPGGGRLSPERFQQLGLAFGMSDGFEAVHYLLESAFADGPEGRELSYNFLVGYERALGFSTNPLFCVLHEPIYCQGYAPRWSAQRVRAEFEEFAPDAARGRVLFTGEMVYPWMMREVERLAPLADVAELLAQRADWPELYDLGRLARNDVPVVAAVYYDDMYVERELSLEAARAIRGARVWITNEFEHDGLRVAGDRVLGRLLEMLRNGA